MLSFMGEILILFMRNGIKYRRRGEQRVHVEHVHVHDGGRAIVRNVGTGGGPKTKKGRDKCKLSSVKHGFYTSEFSQERKNIK